MVCLKCRTENDVDRKYCRNCGARLLLICPQCGFECLAEDKFCGECGANLKPSSAPSPGDTSAREKLELLKRYIPKNLIEKILAQRDKIEGERRRVTVMFCDMEGFTPLSERLGPEGAYTLMDRVYEILIHQVHDFEGTVNEMTGDGIMALFGAPIALEDAPQRAIRSAFAIHREITKFSERINAERGGPLSIKMRVGIHTGQVVVGTLGNDLRVEFKAVGDTVNLASRVEALAEPGTIYVTEDTFKHTEGMFRFEAIGERAVKGKEKPVMIYRVIAPSTRRTRFDVSAERGLTPFVGRDRELELLVDGYERVKGGRGQAFSVTGDAGVGKSRFLYEFRKVVTNEDVNFLEGKCLSYSRGTAYHPVIDILKSYFDVHGGDADLEIGEKVKKGLKTLDADEASTLPYLLELLSVRDSGIEKMPFSPEAIKTNILEALKRIVLKGSELKPLIMAIEDLHWVDKSSEEALKELLDSISASRVLLIFTYRPEFVHTWGGRSYHCQVNLNRLSNRESLIMVSNLLGTKEIGRELEDFILRITEGVPFFIEEFLKSLKDLKVIEQKGNAYVITQNLEEVTVPSTIQDVIMARVDSLPEPARNVLQIGSVIGREFDFGLILKVTGIAETELLARLSILKSAELLFERGIYPQSTLIFKHALTQDAAYHSLLKSTCQKYHERVARVLEEHFPDTVKTQPELLGHHFTEAGLVVKAVPLWQKAGEIAIRRSAHMVAIDHFSKALDLLKSLPETPERKKQELGLQIALYAPLSAVKGYSAPEVGNAYNRARELCEQIGEPAQLFLVLYGLWGHNFVRSNLKTIPQLAEQCLVLARDVDNRALLMEAHRMCGETALFRGEFAPAHQHCEQSTALYDARLHHTHSSIYGQDPGAALLSHGAMILWHLGYPEQALKKAETAVTHSRNWPHPFSLAFALCQSANVFQYCNVLHEVENRAKEALILSEEQKFPFWFSMAAVLHGWALVEKDLKEEGIRQMRKGMEDLRAIQAVLFRTCHLALLAGAYGKAGQIDNGLHAVEEAFATMDETGVGLSRAELYRVKGDLLSLKEESETEVEKCYLGAIDVSRRQNAKSLELRATMRLSRLWQRQGKKKEAHGILAEIHNWFTEGFDTADLKEAKTLLNELTFP